MSVLILACRDPVKGRHAREAIIASKGSPSGKVEVWQVNLAEYSSVLLFGERLRTLSRLDAFIANAGIDVNRWETYEGLESTLTVNVISTLLTAMLAYPKLKETSIAQQQPTHLSFTGSVVHIFAKDKYLQPAKRGSVIESLNDPAIADMNDRYNLSKLLLLLGVRAFARQVWSNSSEPQKHVFINFVNPGWCKTNLFQTNDGGISGRIGLRLIGRTAEQGGRTLVHGITTGPECHGKYVSDCRVKPESTFVRSANGALVENRVWTELMDRLEKIKPGVTYV